MALEIRGDYQENSRFLGKEGGWRVSFAGLGPDFIARKLVTHADITSQLIPQGFQSSSFLQVVHRQILMEIGLARKA